MALWTADNAMMTADGFPLIWTADGFYPGADTHDGASDNLGKRRRWANTQVISESDYRRRVAELRGKKLSRRQREIERAEIEEEFREELAAPIEPALIPVPEPVIYVDSAEEESALAALIAESDKATLDIVDQAIEKIAEFYKQRLH